MDVQLFFPIAILTIAVIGIIISLFLYKTGPSRRFCNNVDLDTGQNLVCTCQGNKEINCRNL